jgi:hypothetical protein
MSREQTTHDYLSLHEKPQLQALYATHGDATVLFSDEVSAIVNLIERDLSVALFLPCQRWRHRVGGRGGGLMLARPG